MVKAKLKICNECSKETYIFSKGLCKSCATKTYKKPNKVSDKQQKRIKEYSQVRKEYFLNLASTICKVCNQREVTDIHHQCGRVGDLLTDTRYFLAVCRECHTFIEENPEWAYANNYSLKRNNKQL